MEQVAIITQLVQDMIAMNCSERQMGHFILNLDTAVRTLTHIKEDAPRQMVWEAKWEAEKQEREAKEAEKMREYLAKKEREEERKKEAQRQRRRELYQLKKAEKKAEEEDWRNKICNLCGGYAGAPLDNITHFCETCYGKAEKQIREAEDKEAKRKRKVEDKWIRKGGEKPEWFGEGEVGQK